MILMRYPGGKEKAVTLSYDDGVVQDIRLVEILGKYGLKATFNINSGLLADEDTKTGRMSKNQAVALYSGSGHEVAAHTYSHPHLAGLAPENITREMLKDRENIEKLFGCTVRGMAYPYGECSEKIKACARACGVAYSRITAPTESFDLPSDWLEFAPTCHHNHQRLFELADEFLNKKLRPMYDKSLLFYLWGHSYEFDDRGNWNRIEKFAEMMGGREDIWYAANIEIYNYVTSFERLEYDAAGEFVYNPSAAAVWLAVSGKTVKLEGGERVSLFAAE